MPDVSSIAPADVRLWVALDVHKFSIVAATLAARAAASPRCSGSRTTERAIRRLIDRLGGPEGLAVCYEAGPGGFDLLRLLSAIGVACDVVAPSLIPVRAGDRVKTDRRDAKKLVRLHRAGELTLREPADAETGGAQGPACAAATTCVCARTRGAPPRRQAAAAPRAHLPRRARRPGRKHHRAWVAPPAPRRPARAARAGADARPPRRRRCASSPRSTPARARSPQREPLGASRSAGCALSRHLDPAPRSGCSPRSATSAASPPARARELARHHPQRVLLRRPAPPRPHHQDRQPPRPPAADRGRLALPPRAPRRHARRRQPHVPPDSPRAPGRPRSACTTATATSPHHGKRSTVVNVAIARELAGFLWAAMTDQPLRDDQRPPSRLNPDHPPLGPGGRRDPPGGPSTRLCDPDSRP